MLRIAVLGAGAWGTALALAFSDRHAVTLWSHAPAEVNALQADRENRQFLPGYPFPASVRVAGDLGEAVTDAKLALIATPLAGLLLKVRGVDTLAFDIRQGAEMGRPSLLSVTARREGDAIQTTVAGRCVPVFRGTTQ